MTSNVIGAILNSRFESGSTTSAASERPRHLNLLGMSQHTLRHVRIARTRVSHCVRYTRSYSAQTAVAQLSQETDDTSYETSSSSHGASTSKVNQLLERGSKQIKSVPIRRKVASSSSSPKKLPEASASTHREQRQFLRTEAYLMKLNSEGVAPTIADLEYFRGEKPVRSTSPQYAEYYNEVVDTINRAFCKEQLVEFLEIYEVSFRRKATKLKLIETILEKAWGWPSLAQVEKAKRERTEVSTRR